MIVVEILADAVDGRAAASDQRHEEAGENSSTVSIHGPVLEEDPTLPLDVVAPVPLCALPLVEPPELDALAEPVPFEKVLVDAVLVALVDVAPPKPVDEENPVADEPPAPFGHFSGAKQCPGITRSLSNGLRA